MATTNAEPVGGDEQSSGHNGCDLLASKAIAATRPGLQNLGNTCYMNALLQVLLSVKALRQHYLTDDGAAPYGLAPPLTRAFAGFVHSMTRAAKSGSTRNVVAPSDLHSAIGKIAPRFKGFRQQDSHELLRFVLNGLEDEQSTAWRKSRQSKLTSAGLQKQLENCTGDVRENKHHEEKSLDHLLPESDTCANDAVAVLSAATVDGGNGAQPASELESAAAAGAVAAAPPAILSVTAPGASPTSLPPPQPPPRSAVECIFGGNLISVVCCERCGYESVTNEPFMDLSLPLSATMERDTSIHDHSYQHPGGGYKSDVAPPPPPPDSKHGKNKRHGSADSKTAAVDADGKKGAGNGKRVKGKLADAPPRPWKQDKSAKTASSTGSSAVKGQSQMTSELPKSARVQLSSDAAALKSLGGSTDVLDASLTPDQLHAASVLTDSRFLDMPRPVILEWIEKHSSAMHLRKLNPNPVWSKGKNKPPKQATGRTIKELKEWATALRNACVAKLTSMEAAAEKASKEKESQQQPAQVETGTSPPHNDDAKGPVDEQAATAVATGDYPALPVAEASGGTCDARDAAPSSQGRQHPSLIVAAAAAASLEADALVGAADFPSGSTEDAQASRAPNAKHPPVNASDGDGVAADTAAVTAQANGIGSGSQSSVGFDLFSAGSSQKPFSAPPSRDAFHGAEPVLEVNPHHADISTAPNGGHAVDSTRQSLNTADSPCDGMQATVAAVASESSEADSGGVGVPDGAAIKHTVGATQAPHDNSVSAADSTALTLTDSTIDASTRQEAQALCASLYSQVREYLVPPPLAQMRPDKAYASFGPVADRALRSNDTLESLLSAFTAPERLRVASGDGYYCTRCNERAKAEREANEKEATAGAAAIATSDGGDHAPTAHELLSLAEAASSAGADRAVVVAADGSIDNVTRDAATAATSVIAAPATAPANVELRAALQSSLSATSEERITELFGDGDESSGVDATAADSDAAAAPAADAPVGIVDNGRVMDGAVGQQLAAAADDGTSVTVPPAADSNGFVPVPKPRSRRGSRSLPAAAAAPSAVAAAVPTSFPAGRRKGTAGTAAGRLTAPAKPAGPPPTLTDATKRTLIAEDCVPDYLTVHLKRFKASLKGALTKVTARVSVPETLDLTPFLALRASQVPVAGSSAAEPSADAVAEAGGPPSTTAPTVAAAEVAGSVVVGCNATVNAAAAPACNGVDGDHGAGDAAASANGTCGADETPAVPAADGDGSMMIASPPPSATRQAPSASPVERRLYRLLGIVVHSGGLHGGHYTSYVRTGKAGTASERWLYCNDSSVSASTLQQVLHAEAYICMYERVKEV